ncbi:MAG: hypothetical protein R3B82_16940 [Sandaracinaceae bacterium]
MAGGNGNKTDRFRVLIEPEAIFDRFVKNANASTESALPDDDEVTGCVSREEVLVPRGGPPAWDHRVTVVNPDPEPLVAATRKAPREEKDDEITVVGAPPQPDREGTKPDAPMPLAMKRAFDTEDEDEEPDYDDGMTVPRASALTTDSGQRILLLTKVKATPEPSSSLTNDSVTNGSVTNDTVEAEVTDPPSDGSSGGSSGGSSVGSSDRPSWKERHRPARSVTQRIPRRQGRARPSRSTPRPKGPLRRARRGRSRSRPGRWT